MNKTKNTELEPLANFEDPFTMAPTPTTLDAYTSSFAGTDDQNAALDALLDWCTSKDSKTPQLACLLGLAGTGKTTVATELIERVRYLSLSTAVCAPTGKAASVLRRKGCADATTLHRAIYKLNEEESEEKGQLVWELRSNARQASLVIVDEASMITEDQIVDLRRVFGRILLVGDPGQLPPVTGLPALSLRMPQHRLTKIHRQAEESGIIRFAHAIRAGESISNALKQGGKDVIKGLPDPEKVTVGVSLCAKNQTRTGANAMARYYKGFKGTVPNVGETLMCLRNRAEDGWCNGMLCVVEEVTHSKGSPYALIVAMCDDGERRESRVWLECLDSSTMPKRDDVPAGLEPFWFGYAVTTHKAQGSEWPIVEVMESWPTWGRTPEELTTAKETARRWAYTAATRAKQTLYWGG